MAIASGYFSDDSLLRIVQREQVVAFSGPRALLMQAAHPVAFEGFFAQSASLQEPYERLARTARVLETIGFGSREGADRASARVRAVHAQVRGQLPRPAGRFPAGTPYAADDPALLLWILACLADSALVVFERYVRRLSGADRERYWRDYRVIGNLFGLEDRHMPTGYSELADYLREMVTGEDLCVTDAARELGVRIVLRPPVPLTARPLLELVNFITIGLLPARIRRGYRLRWDPARELALRGGTKYARHMVVPLLPERLRLSRAARTRAAA